MPFSLLCHRGVGYALNLKYVASLIPEVVGSYVTQSTPLLGSICLLTLTLGFQNFKIGPYVSQMANFYTVPWNLATCACSCMPKFNFLSHFVLEIAEGPKNGGPGPRLRIDENTNGQHRAFSLSKGLIWMLWYTWILQLHLGRMSFSGNFKSYKHLLSEILEMSEET